MADDYTPIYVLQGAAHISPLLSSATDSASVTTRGVVTAVASNGFYIQDAVGDGNSATSDGIFIFTSVAPGVGIGEEVQVSGTLREFRASADDLTVTQITVPTV